MVLLTFFKIRTFHFNTNIHNLLSSEPKKKFDGNRKNVEKQKTSITIIA